MLPFPLSTWCRVGAKICLLLPTLIAAQVQPMALQLPTTNTALFTDQDAEFYQFVDRTFEGETSTPWEGGRFGFVRDPRRIGNTIAYARFHEGLDIKPIARDAAGEPLDQVMAISAGAVVHVSKTPSASNYGRYIVVRHDWGYGPFFSLYAHLADTNVEIGDSVQGCHLLGRMGYTGAGIDKRRAHLHIELTLIWSADFQSWYASGFASPNVHGIYNGQNLIGLDIANLFLAHRKDPSLTAAQFVRQTAPYFEIVVPGSAKMELLTHYPWLLQGNRPAQTPPSWRVQFSEWGLPVSITPGTDSYAAPSVLSVRDSPLPHALNTRGLITGSGREASLTRSGLSFIRLACGLP